MTTALLAPPMGPTLPSSDLRSSAVAFGQGLRRWRVRQGWAQDTAQDWGEEASFPHVFSSQWSQLETARMERPGRCCFIASAS